MRLRLTDTDLRELAKMYRREAATQRREARERQDHTTEHNYIEAAKRADARAVKLEDMAAKGQDFILVATRPFDGGPPSLLIVGGSDASDGSSFLLRKTRA